MTKKVLLLILDGWGIGKSENDNPIYLARPLFWDKMLTEYPNSVINTREENVGLPFGCLSGSEVGHLTLGAGRVVLQGAMRIDNSFKSKEFFENDVLKKAVEQVRKLNSRIHFVGLLSDGGIHAHFNHLLGLIDWAKQNDLPVSLHLFLDGRDMSPMSALKLLQEKILPVLNDKIKISTICGRSISMDRSENWDRTEKIFKLLTNIEETKNDLIKILEKNYEENISDEFIEPISLNNDKIKQDDVVLFFNFRADRMRQLLRLFVEHAPKTVQDNIVVPKNLFLITMTEYDSDFKEAWVLFPPYYPKNTLGEWLSLNNLRQFRITETEKYAHITYFFNGGQEQVFPGEDRLVIPSLGLTNYAGHPEMSLDEIVSSLERVLLKKEYDFVVCNFANGDMVGHSGDLKAGIKAVKYIDKALEKIISICQKNEYTAVITADHGNIEKMIEGQFPNTAHTFNDVPLLVTDKKIKLRKKGFLYEVAPTILKIMELKKPDEMTGEALF
ncbi:MAG: 2,3-bisphosphoglycerate-independent phosphoglycerate mutase [Patescibacteria group bacterium]